MRIALCTLAGVVIALCVFALPSMWIHIPDEYPDITYVFYCIVSALYIVSIPFFIAVYKALQLLKYIDKKRAFSLLSVKALKHIAYCGTFISVIFAALLPFFYIWAQYEDAPGLIIINMALSGAALTVSVFAAVVGQLLREAIAIKAENDLTV